MATGVASWSKTAASNSTADSNVNWAEGQAPSSVNDSARAMMASVKKWCDDISGSITTGGTSTAFTITTNQVFGTAAAMSGMMFCIIPHTTSGAAPTLAVDGLTARNINVSTGVNVASGALVSGTPYVVTYIHASTEFILKGGLGSFGASTFSGVISGADGSVSAPSYSFTSDTDSGVYRIGANNLGVGVNGAKVLDIGTSGLGVTGTLTSTGAATVTAGGLTVTAGGLTVTDGAVSFPAASIANAALASPASAVLISTKSASSSATIDFTTGLDDTYDAYMLVLSSVKPASDDVEGWIRIGTGVGPTWQSGASAYQYAGFYYGTTNSNNISSTSDSKIKMNISAASIGVGNATGECLHGALTFNNPEATDFFNIKLDCNYDQASGEVARTFQTGRYNTAGAITGIRFLFSTGNIASGRLSLYGLTKS